MFYGVPITRKPPRYAKLSHRTTRTVHRGFTRTHEKDGESTRPTVEKKQLQIAFSAVNDFSPTCSCRNGCISVIARCRIIVLPERCRTISSAERSFTRNPTFSGCWRKHTDLLSTDGICCKRKRINTEDSLSSCLLLIYG